MNALPEQGGPPAPGRSIRATTATVRAPAAGAGRTGFEGATVTDPNDADQQMASSEQMDELRRLASAAGEDVPDTLRAAEAEQRITELRTLSGG